MLIGIDIGTGGCKVTLIDYRKSMVKTAFEEYVTHRPRPTWCEQDPEEWYSAMKAAVRRLLAEVNGKVDALSIDGQTHAAVLVDENGVPLRRSIIWTDQRSIKQAEKIREIIGHQRIIEITYNPAQPLFTLPQLLWVMEEEPAIWRRVSKILMAKDYIRFKLTNELDGLTDHTDAMGTLMFDSRRFEWSREICDKLGIDPSILPKAISSDSIAGYVSKEAAGDLGVDEGTPIVIGCHDVSAEPLAAGAISDGDAFIKLATAGVISMTTKDPKPDLKGRTVTYCLPTIRGKPPGWFTKTATTACGTSYRWFRETFCELEAMKAREQGRSVYALMDELAEKAPPGSMALIYHPYLDGEGAPYYDPNLRGSFFGITSLHRREHFCRAVLEGVAFSIKDSLSIFKELGITANKWAIIGGGSKSKLWCQIVSDIFGVELLKPAYEDASFGTALLAGIGVGIFKDLEEAVKNFFKIERRITPDMERHHYYEKIFKIYRKIHDSLGEVYRELSKIQQENV